MTAPIAPRDSSFHMKWNRSWPGVPNRYSTISGVSEMRPKSIATVVVCLVPIWLRSSTWADAVVIIASDRSGSISEIVFTKVDLPTPKPPATTILTGIFPMGRGSEVADTVEHPFQQTGVVLGLVRHVHDDRSIVDQVGHEHACDADRNLESGCDLDERHRRLHEVDQLGGFPPVGTEVVRRPSARLDLCLQ